MNNHPAQTGGRQAVVKPLFTARTSPEGLALRQTGQDLQG